jgi:hypothetical protein
LSVGFGSARTADPDLQDLQEVTCQVLSPRRPT